MKKHLSDSSDASREPSAKALARYAANVWIQETMSSGDPRVTRLSSVLLQAARKEWNGYRFGVSTLERNYYKYRDGGFASLESSPRSDRGKSRKLPEALAELLLQRRRQYPRLPVTVLLDELAGEGADLLEHASISTIHRLLREHGLDRAMIGHATLEACSGPQKAFEMPAANMLWMTDMMYGPVLRDENGRTVKTRLFALLDDHSRLCVQATYFDSEAQECFLQVFREAIRQRGVPDKIYTDQGKVFTSHLVKGICARLGTKLSHAQPYHAWSKGKIERFFRTVQEQFQSRLLIHPVHNLPDLNGRLLQWLGEDYHQSVHSATGQAPAARFAAFATTLRQPPPDEELLALFMRRENRRVRRDGCVMLKANAYEVPLHLRGMNIEIRYHEPPGANPVEIWFKDKFVAVARPLDKQLNATRYTRRKT